MSALEGVLWNVPNSTICTSTIVTAYAKVTAPKPNKTAISDFMRLTRKRQATAGDGAICFHFILHNSSLNLAAQRPAVGFIDWLGRMVCVRILMRVQKDFPQLMQRLLGDINLGVVNASTKRCCANVAKHELQAAISAAKQNRCPKPRDTFPLVLDGAVILDDLAQENLAL